MECPFERDEQCSAFFEGLRNKLIPLKFAFVGSAAHTHDKLAMTAGYSAVVGNVVNEVKFLSDTLKEIGVQEVSAIVELGPGNGVHSATFYQVCGEELKDLRSVLLVDYSSTLLKLARGRIEPKSPQITFDTQVADLEGPTLALEVSEFRSSSVCFVMLGNTIGNVESIQDTLDNIRQNMQRDDVLLFSYALFDKRISADRYLAGYLTDELKIAATEALYMTGAAPLSFSFELRFDATSKQIVGEALFKKTTTLNCGQRSTTLRAGDRVRCFLSRRLTPEEIHEALNKSGLSIIMDSRDHTNALGLVTCQPN